MKKLFTLLVGMGVCLGAYAQSFDSGGLYYVVRSQEDKTCAVTGKSKDYEGTNLEIPSIVVNDGIEYTVIEIEGKSFSGYEWSSVSLPSTLEIIDEVAFANVKGLQEITIPNSVNEIRNEAFADCKDLEIVHLGTSLQLMGIRTFAGSSVRVVTASGESPAQLESGFAETFPSNPLVAVEADLLTVYKSQWEGSNIVENLPAETLTLDMENCTLLPGESVQLIANAYPENAPFGFFSSDTDVITVNNQGLVTADRIMEGYEADITAISVNGVRATCHIQTGYMEHFQYEGFDFAILPDEEFEVALTDFDHDATNVVIPERVQNGGIEYMVTVIGYKVFNRCDSLKEVTVPASVKKISGENFNSCPALKKVTFADGPTTLEIGNSNFIGVEQLTQLYIGRNLVNATAWFGYNSSLANVIFGTEVTYVPDYLFQSCHNLAVVVSNNVVPPTLGIRPLGYYPNREKIKIVVPEESIEAYKEAWGEVYPNIIIAVDAQEIRFEPDEVTVYSGQSFPLSLVVEPEEATVFWSSSDPSLITVDRDGKISYPVNYSGTTPTGEVIITVASLNGLSAECKLNAERWFTFSEDNVTMSPGTENKIEVFRVDDLGESPIRWSSNNETCVSVDAEGMLYAHKCGDATITASVYVSKLGWSVNYPVKVQVRDYPQNVTPAESVIRIEKGEEQAISLIFEPEDDPYLIREIAWTVERPEIAEVKEYEGGYLVVGLEYGTTVLHGLTPNGIEVELHIEVGNLTEEVILLNPDITVVCRTGEALQLEFLRGEDGEINTEMTWTVDNPVIAHIGTQTYWNEETQKEETVYRVVGDRVGTTAFTGATVNGYEVRGIVNVVGVYIDLGTVVSNSFELTIGEEVELKIEASPEDLLDNLTYNYREQILSISSDRVMKGEAYGGTWLSAYYNYDGKRYETNSIWVTVHPTEGHISLSETECILKEDNGNESLTAYLPVGDDSELTWTSSDSDIVEVEGNGIYAQITYKSAGKAIITVSTPTGVSAECEVTCVSVTFSESEIELGLGKTYQLDLKLIPEAEWDKLYWFFDDMIVTVDENGLMQAVGVGETWVSVEFYVPAYKQWFNTSVKVRVIEDIIEIADLTLTPNTLILKVGESEQLMATVLPEDATNKTLVWSSSDESVAKVDENGLVTMIGVGNATISVATTDGSDLIAYCYLNGISGIEAIFADGEVADIYDMSGVLIKKDATADDLSKLAQGVYILRRGNVSMKLIRK